MMMTSNKDMLAKYEYEWPGDKELVTKAIKVTGLSISKINDDGTVTKDKKSFSYDTVGDLSIVSKGFTAAESHIVQPGKSYFITSFGNETFYGHASNDPFRKMLEELTETWPVLNKQVLCPDVDDDKTCNYKNFSVNVSGLIVHLNDYHRWTREAIADWIEKMES